MTHGFPIIIADWQKTCRGEIIRIAIDRYNNRFTIDIRTWRLDPNGVFKPGRNGLTLAIRHLPRLAEHLSRAVRRAYALGLVEPARKDPSGYRHEES